MDITPTRDDLGTEALKRENQTRQVKETDHVEPYAAIAPSERHGEKSPYPDQERRRSGERRKGQRRQRQGQTLLDTRTPHERRKQQRRLLDRQRGISHAPSDAASTAEQSAPTPPTTGIDETV